MIADKDILSISDEELKLEANDINQSIRRLRRQILDFETTLVGIQEELRKRRLKHLEGNR